MSSKFSVHGVVTVSMLAMWLAKASLPTPNGVVISTSDSQCTKEVGNSGQEHGSYWPIEFAYPTCEVYSSVTFAGAESMSGTGYDVYWDIGQPAEGCEILIMSPVGQDVKGSNCGNVILDAKDAKCYYTHLDTTFMVQYCCGSDDCAAATNGASDKRSLDSIMRRANMKMHNIAKRYDNATIAPQPLERFTLAEKWAHQAATKPPGRSLAARASSWASAKMARNAKDASRREDSAVGLFERDDPTVTCDTPVRQGDSYTKAAPQLKLTSTLICNTVDPCMQNVENSIQVSHSVTNEQSTTLTTTAGVSISVEAGLDFLVDAKTSVTASLELSQAVEQSTGETDQTTVTATISSTFSQPPGTTGYIWFTPTLDCAKFTVNCNNVPVELEKCDPKILPSGEQAGELGFATTG